MRRLRAALGELKIGLAYDDFGAGQARLVELVDVPPDYLKFDMKLVQNLKTGSTERRRMMASLVKMGIDLGITPLAEGIETQDDHDACREIGFSCAQGFLYGYPTLPKRLVPAEARAENARIESESSAPNGCLETR
jgi:EAL domain-containing protein (putative c-di-GMP-specific phosphodiesterase class I)